MEKGNYSSLDLLSDKTKAFYAEFCKKFPLEKENYIPYSEFMFKHTPIYILTKYGMVKTSPKQMMKGVFPTIKSAVNQTEYFINYAKTVHGNKYDYSETKSIKGEDYVYVRCKEHGLFRQSKTNHLDGQGCNICANIKNSLKRRPNLADFIDIAEKLHHNFYDYSQVSFERGADKILITCPKHGLFSQSYRSHLKGRGCRKCAAKMCHKSSDIAFLYIFRLSSIDEYFYKIGFSRKLEGRIDVISKYYDVEVKFTQQCNSVTEAYNIEQFLLNMLYKSRYTPKHKFSGSEECLDDIDMKTINFLLNFKLNFYGVKKFE